MSSLYLHCDPTASHYLKVLLDMVFGAENFRNEIIWNYGRGASNTKYSLPKGHETILYYTKSKTATWKHPLAPYSEKLIKLLKKDEKGYYYTRGARTGRRKIADWEKAEIGVYICLEETTKPMRAEAAQAGYYHSDTWNRDYPRVQILTIKELLDGKQIDMPPIQKVNQTFRRAKREKGKDTNQLGLLNGV